MVGDSDRFLPEPIGLGEQFIELGCTVQHGIFGMCVKVNKFVTFTCRCTGQDCVNLRFHDGLATVSLALVSQTIQSVTQILWVRRGVVNILAGYGVFKSEPNSVQPLSGKPEFCCQCGIGIIGQIPN